MTLCQTKQASKGFTLLETVIVILMLGVAATAVIRLNTGLFYSANDSRDVQINSQLLQACAEKITASRRLTGLNETAGFYDALCENLPIGPVGSDRFTVSTSASVGESCPAGATCLDIVIRVNGTSGNVGPVHLQLMKY
jgi:prepilin-type N-terminal cleavage/methylation domain-containing protein